MSRLCCARNANIRRSDYGLVTWGFHRGLRIVFHWIIFREELAGYQEPARVQRLRALQMRYPNRVEARHECPLLRVVGPERIPLQQIRRWWLSEIGLVILVRNTYLISNARLMCFSGLSALRPEIDATQEFAWSIVLRGYMFRHENRCLPASNVIGSLQLMRAEAPLHKPRRVAAPSRKTCGGSFCALPARLRLRNHSHNLLGGWRE